MNWRNFLNELKRRNVYKVAIAYDVLAWLMIQIDTGLSFFRNSELGGAAGDHFNCDRLPAVGKFEEIWRLNPIVIFGSRLGTSCSSILSVIPNF
jgi:hypothetical protein